MLNILADEALPEVQAAFSAFGSVRTLPGRQIDAQATREADVLLLRSITRVNAALLQGSRVRFVGTATSGFDHLDTDWLTANGIHWVHAPGCNAQAVAEYVASALVLLARRTGEPLQGRRLGILGLGQTGSRVARVAEALGLRVAFFDPAVTDAPWERCGSTDDLLQADMLSLHVPLTRAGSHPTRHWLNAERLARLKPGTWLVNASRGEVADNRALLQRLQQGADLRVALDVWENEPEPDAALLQLVDIATPHLAGYGLAGKYRGVQRLHRALGEWLGRSEVWVPPSPPVAGWLQAEGATLEEIVLQASDLPRLDQRFRAAYRGSESPAAAFDACRRQAANRAEFADWGWQAGQQPATELRPALAALGFQV